MKTFIKPILAASLVSAAALPALEAPAFAQAQGSFATVNTPAVIISSNAFRTAFQQIGTSYATQISTITARGQEQQTLLQQLDTNSDGQLDEAEQTAARSTPQWQRLQAIEQEVAGLNNQLDAARIYVVEQMLAQYGPILQKLVQDERIQMVVSPDALIYAVPGVDISEKMVTAVNAAAPALQITPPPGWQPQRRSVAVYQQIQQALAVVQAQAAQQQAAGTPAESR